MLTRRGISRRNILKFGGLVLAGGSTPLMQISLAAEGQTSPLLLITSNSTLTHTLLAVLESQGYMHEFGLKPTIVHLNDNSKVVPALISGEADLCGIIGFSTIFPAIEKGAALKILAGAGLLTQDAVYTRDPNIKSIKDLEGRTIGTGAVGALTYQLMVSVLEKFNVDVKKVRFRNIGSNTAIFRAVVAGTVDAGPGGIDVYDEQAKYGVHVPKGGNLWDELPQYTNQGIYTADRAIKEKREALVRSLAAFAKLFRFVQAPESKDAFLQGYQKVTGKHDTKAALTEWNFIQKYHPYAGNLVLSQERIDFMQKLNLRIGMQKKLLPFSEVADMSLAQDAIKMIGGPT